MARCFVIQGFHKKQDYPTGRLLDLDASYEVIREAVTDAGLECVRADEIRHSGTIDTPMFQQILNADLVIADLSTYNVNAAYELGVRHALRPHATIIVAESGFKYPFDFSHISIQQYEHLGDDIGRREAQRFRTELKTLIEQVMANARTDSPVYVFVPGLEPPAAGRGDDAPPPPPGGRGDDAPPPPPGGRGDDAPPPPPGGRGDDAPPPPPGGRGDDAPPPPPGGRGDDAPPPPPGGRGGAAAQRSGRSIKSMTDEARAALAADRFVEAKETLLELRSLQERMAGAAADDAVLQMLALATYKSKQPSPEAALLAARDLLTELEPETSNDTETLGLWGAIHKRLWDLHKDPQMLDRAITAYERGYHIRQDYYNGINFAFLLNVRADHERGTRPAHAIADWVQAERTRATVIDLCRASLDQLPVIDDDTSDAEKARIAEQKYWILATLEEAAAGLGDDAAEAEWHQQAAQAAAADWMVQSTAEQIARLKALLADPPTRAISS